jgi:two-component system CheB/CheR fusion protein
MATEVRSDLSGLSLLIVDDELDSLEVFGELLRLVGAEVTLASSASEALEISARLDFDVILSDVAMPGGDGLTLVQKFREIPHTRHTVCIAVTGMATPGERERVLAAGFDAHLSKPVLIDRLIDVIRRLTAGRDGAPG